jgi:hypothetical protein
MADPRRRAVTLALALLAVVGLGILSRRSPIGLHLYDKSLGDALYAIAVYLTLAVLLPRQPPRRVALWAIGCCLVVEAVQLTGIPARHAAHPLVRWLIGTRFAWEDIACYLVGVAANLALDLKMRRDPRHREPTARQDAR